MNEPQWENGTAKKYLDEMGGSKAGAYYYLRDHHPELHAHLPVGTTYFPPGTDFGNIIDDFRVDARKIIRGCHALDVQGMVDVVPSYPNLKDIGDFWMAIMNCKRSAASQKVRSYMEYESGKPFDGKIGILAQNYYGDIKGSIIEHPHEKDTYRIEHVTGTYGGHESIDVYIVDGAGNAFTDWTLGEKLACARIQQIIGLYRKIQQTGLMPSSHSFQMEYGVTAEHVLFYQARIFRLFEKKADFAVEVGSLATGSIIPYCAYGVTPEEGIELPLARLSPYAVQQHEEIESMAYWHHAPFEQSSPVLDAQPRNLKAYFANDTALLQHGHFRWMQKSPLTLQTYSGITENGFEDADDLQVRIISNGIKGKYAIVDS